MPGQRKLRTRLDGPSRNMPDEVGYRAGQGRTAARLVACTGAGASRGQQRMRKAIIPTRGGSVLDGLGS